MGKDDEMFEVWIHFSGQLIEEHVRQRSFPLTNWTTGPQAVLLPGWWSPLALQRSLPFFGDCAIYEIVWFAFLCE